MIHFPGGLVKNRPAKITVLQELQYFASTMCTPCPVVNVGFPSQAIVSFFLSLAMETC